VTTLGSKLGTNSWGQYFNPSKFDYATFKTHWDYLIGWADQMPINWLRIGYTYYDDGFNSDGTYNFERLDYAIQAAQEKGFKVIIPIWFVSDGLTSSTIDYSTYYSKWLDMIQAIINRYSGKGIYYEAVDEALSGGHFWLGQSLDDGKISDIVSMNSRIYKLAAALDPTAKFINGDLASSDNFASAKDKGMFNFGDYISYHVYLTNPESILNNQDQLSFVQDLKNTGMTLSCTEFGFGYPSNFNGANTRREQASKTLREIFILDMLGFEQIIQFTMEDSDLSWTFETAYSSGSDGSLNLSGSLFQSMMLELHDYEFSEKLDSSDGDYLLKYVSPGNSDKVVFWTTNDNHTESGYDFTDIPQIATLESKTSSKIDEISLEKLTGLNFLSNFQNNVSKIQSAIKSIDDFTNIYGMETYAIPELTDLTGFDYVDRLFAEAYLKNIALIWSAIKEIIDDFSSKNWLGNGTYVAFTNPTPFNQENINQNWKTFETDINQIIEVINEATA
jgi:hypothetical protein